MPSNLGPDPDLGAVVDTHRVSRAPQDLVHHLPVAAPHHDAQPAVTLTVDEVEEDVTLGRAVLVGDLAPHPHRLGIGAGEGPPDARGQLGHRQRGFLDEAGLLECHRRSRYWRLTPALWP